MVHFHFSFKYNWYSSERAETSQWHRTAIAHGKKEPNLHLGIWLKTPGPLRPAFDQWDHCTPLVCADPVLNWSQTSCFCLGEHKEGTWNIFPTLWEWRGRATRHQLLSKYREWTKGKVALLSIYHVPNPVQDYICILSYPSNNYMR